MFQSSSRFFVQQLQKEFRKLSTQSHVLAKHASPNFKLQRALVVTKLSRYEFEQQRYPHLSKPELEERIRNRGSDFEKLICLHNRHKDFEKKIVQCFRDVGCEVKLANRVEFRSSLSKDIMKWADVIIPIGGDGTFLVAAGRASPLFSQHKTPIVGFNSDPQHSEGRLMLHKRYSENPCDAAQRIKSGDFTWTHRTRIRTSIIGSNGKTPESTDLYRHTITKMEQEKTKPEYLSSTLARKYSAKFKRVLPYLALNEVFIGEQQSARVSLLQLIVDENDVVNKTKCSGLCVSTGTGSTSWHTSINRLEKRQIVELLRVISSSGFNNSIHNVDPDELCTKYNQNLLFTPDDPRLCYSIREQICVGVWPKPKEFESQKFVQKLFIESRCIDASLVIDGSISYLFNDGAKALLEVYPEDALLTITLD